jgi:hypothetical protein
MGPRLRVRGGLSVDGQGVRILYTYPERVRLAGITFGRSVTYDMVSHGVEIACQVLELRLINN